MDRIKMAKREDLGRIVHLTLCKNFFSRQFLEGILRLYRARGYKANKNDLKDKLCYQSNLGVGCGGGGDENEGLDL